MLRCNWLTRLKWVEHGVCALVCLGLACDNLPTPAFTTLMDARRITAELLADVRKAADATNRAVMADTDQSSAEFAQESRAQTEAVERKSKDLEAMLRDLRYSGEVALLGEFHQAFDRSRALDAEILGLAVENTNLKAQRLSFGPAAEAADAFCRALEALPAEPALQVAGLKAMLGVREVQVLEAPHIAAAEDAVMGALEQRMAAADAATRKALAELVQRAGEPALQPAHSALDRFTTAHTELLALSRRNSNVRSLALALGQKRTRTAACEGLLQTLAERLAKYQYPARR